ncbi:MAG: M56 family metallopeptidase [Muribaculaceae bacterium]|nr:M56 family metallopeptidase [bacterium]MCM1494036.1 M56 family metallopeptidase [Muribaculaceae bacterium]
MSLLQMSFAGTVMILAIIVIRALAINLLPKKTFLALWGIAVARLLLPFCIPSAFSVYSLIGNPSPAVNSVKGPQTAVTLPSDIYGQTVIPDNISNTVPPVSAWTVVWGAGVLVCALVFAIAYRKCRQEFQTSLPVDNGFIQSWLNEHRLKRPISIRQSNRFSAPLTYGIFRPVILMPISTDWENTKSLLKVSSIIFPGIEVHLSIAETKSSFVLTFIHLSAFSLLPGQSRR